MSLVEQNYTTRNEKQHVLQQNPDERYNANGSGVFSSFDATR